MIELVFAATSGLLIALSALQEGPTQCPTSPGARFDPQLDLFLPQFDIKTDVDDLHSAAAVGTMLRSPALRCIRSIAVYGAYGIQEGDFVPAPSLFDMAFGEDWLDAHSDREGTVGALSSAVIETLQAGGDVWIMEGGQSDVSALVVQRVKRIEPALDLQRMHIVQHSDWNEEVTSKRALEVVESSTDYIRIPDGNGGGNGSPDFNVEDGSLWSRLVADEQVGEIWAEARRVANVYNGRGYENPSVRAGGLDFSDTVEAVYIFGYDAIETPVDFADTFLVIR